MLNIFTRIDDQHGVLKSEDEVDEDTKTTEDKVDEKTSVHLIRHLDPHFTMNFRMRYKRSVRGKVNLLEEGINIRKSENTLSPAYLLILADPSLDPGADVFI